MRKIIGHKNIIDSIHNRALNDSFSHANLIVGNDGIGKSIIAKCISNHIIKDKNGVESVDIVKYYPSSNSFGVDDVRNIINEVNKKPYEGDKKVLILYRCDKLTVQAQNALLKTIEEPPHGVYLILLSDSLEIILDTIKSRCQIYKLTPLSKEEILNYIDNNYADLTLDDKKSALAYSSGIPGKVDKFINDEKLKNLRDICIGLFEDILKREQGIVLKYEELLKNSKEDKVELLNILLSYIRDIMLFKELNNNELIVNSDKEYKIKDISRGISYKKLNSMLEYIEEARINFNSNTNYSMTVSVLLMGFAEV
ncbi:DNA polymerase III subunit delta' [Clostridium chromiireducens]|uniref:DNA polymerase III subunit delta' n=1 Tax=Clostridium chromiireducens TaxID=225345 RepID=A0A1V4ID16_9CLOT|nr:DNA polymerase III subunit delta' [Clostridium chromiireducens]OPJ57407.1 DNA polymerase III subunit tau [Clostridium chromiireducens]RII32617.1 DNA polymerase III subunit delta' [Clostridium chromiireducens]